MKIAPIHYLPVKWGFPNFPSFLSFRIGSIAQKENSETLETFNLNFFFHVLKDSTCRYQRNDVNSLAIRPKKNK